MEKPSAYIHKHNHTQENIRKIIKYYSKSLKTTINIIKTNEITKKNHKTRKKPNQVHV